MNLNTNIGMNKNTNTIFIYCSGPPPNLGSAVASSMHLTNSSDPMGDPSSHYKMIEPSHDMMYYSVSLKEFLNFG